MTHAQESDSRTGKKRKKLFLQSHSLLPSDFGFNPRKQSKTGHFDITKLASRMVVTQSIMKPLINPRVPVGRVLG